MFGEDNVEEYLDEYTHSEDIDNDSLDVSGVELEDDDLSKSFERDNGDITELDLTKQKDG